MIQLTGIISERTRSSGSATSAGRHIFYTGIPFAEFFSASFEDKFTEDSDYLESSIYTPSFSLAFTRNFGSEISDLYIPSDIVFDFEKEFKKQEDSYLNTYTLGIRDDSKGREPLRRIRVKSCFQLLQNR